MILDDLVPSDVTLLVDFVLAATLLLYFSLGHPRTWYRDRLGWVIFGYAMSTVAFIGLIAWAIVFGQKAAEPIRFIIGAGMGIALALKIFAVYRERREARLAALSPGPNERATMTDTVPTIEEVKEVTTIWYKAQRVLRTAFSTLLTILPIAPQIIAIVDGQWETPWLAAVGVQAVALNSVVTRIMAIPTVNAWLTKIGLGSVPKSAVYVSPATGTPHIKTDPKAAK